MKKNQRTVSFEPKVEDIIQSLRIDKERNIDLSYNQVINSLVKHALKSKGLL